MMATSSRCAACKQLRRRCPSNCIFLPYFPPNDPQRFAYVHRIYGTSNVGKMLQQVEEHEQGNMAECLYYDPVYGCVGIIAVLQQQIYRFECLLAKVEAEIQLLQAQGVAPQSSFDFIQS